MIQISCICYISSIIMLSYSKILKFCALVLMLMTFTLSISYTVDFHYCQGTLKSYSFCGKAKNCHEMADELPSCHKNSSCTKKAVSGCADRDYSCCNNRTVIFESDFADKIPLYNNSSFKTYVFVVSNAASSFNYFYRELEDVQLFECYKPPLIPRDIRVLFEIFLL